MLIGISLRNFSIMGSKSNPQLSYKKYESAFEYVYWHIKRYWISPITMKFHSFCTLTHNLLAHCGATVARCRSFATLWFMKNHIYAYFLLPVNRSYNEMFVCNWVDVDGFCEEARLNPNDKSVSFSGHCWKHSWQASPHTIKQAVQSCNVERGNRNLVCLY